MNRNDQQFMAEKIRTQYMEKQSTELDALRTLDANEKSYTVKELKEKYNER